MSLFSMELNTKNTLLRAYGEMFPDEPCMVLQSKKSTEPAGPVARVDAAAGFVDEPAHAVVVRHAAFLLLQRRLVVLLRRLTGAGNVPFL